VAAEVREDDHTRFEIRPAKVDDAGALARLSNQFGYAASSRQVHRRLKQILADPTHAVFVAEILCMQSGAPALAGWVHVYVERTLESDPTVEFGGMIVEENQRGCGVGTLLVKRAERWANKTRCLTMTVRSNVLRIGAHTFYRRLGYRLVKNQKVFRKNLKPA